MTNVPDGTYSFNYEDGTGTAQTFSGVSVSSDSATITGLGSGNYSNISVTVDGCTSDDDVDIVLNASARPNYYVEF